MTAVGGLLALAALLMMWPARRDGSDRLASLELGGRTLPGAHPPGRESPGVPRSARSSPIVAAIAPGGPPHPGLGGVGPASILIAAAVGVAVAAVLGGWPGLVLGTGSAVGWVVVARRREPAAGRRRRLERAAALPFSLALLAVCLRSGLTTAAAVRAVATVLPGPLQSDLVRIARALSSGSSPGSAWESVRGDDVLGPVSRAVVRAADTGSALAAAFDGAGADARAERRTEAQVNARRSAVLVLAPLGLCFLPAFVCLGIVPIVLGIADTVLP